MTSSPESTGGDWLAAVRAYLGVTAVANLMWEAFHLPLYTIWTSGSLQEQAFAVLHCTAGDVLIALAALAVALSDRRTTKASRSWQSPPAKPVNLI